MLVGDDPGSRSYVAGKHRDCAEVGITSHRVDLPADASQAQVDEAIHGLNADPTCTGYIVQLPLPKGLDESRALELIDPEQGRRRPAPHEPRAARPRHHRLRCRARRAASSSCCAATTCRSTAPRSTVVGRGVTVGRPLGLLLTRKSENATVTLCHTGTRDLAAHTRGADIVVAAAGVAHLITADHGQAGGRGARRRHHPHRRRPRRRRAPRRPRGRRLRRPDARRRRPDDPRDAARQRGRGRRARRPGSPTSTQS